MGRQWMFVAAALGLAALKAAEFPTPYNTEKETIPFLKPDDALALVKAPDGFKVTMFAAEPMVQQPIDIKTDARGRIWVCENYTYSERAKNFDTALRDRISILEDSDGDGKADKRTVFWDEGVRVTSVLPGFGGAFVLAPPQLLFVPDRDGNDAPDSAPVVLLDGFDAFAVRHNIANGLKLGPDGWIYGRHGILATSKVGAPGTPEDQRAIFNAAIWRFHPGKKKFEVVCQGTTNPWGNDWDENGQHFFINTVIGHLWHVIPGAYYKKMYGEHPNPYLYELIDQTADHVHWDTRETWSDIRELGVTATTSERGGGHAHSGFMFYLGDNWPAKFRNTALTVNYHGKRLNNDRIERAGATYTAKHLPDPISFGDPWFRGVELTSGPDGGVYVADWSDIGECHDETGIHRTSGRIYKIVSGDPKPWSGDLRSLSNEALVEMQFSKNEWFVRQARQVLQERSPIISLQTVGQIPLPLRSMWASYAVGSFDENLGSILLGFGDEQIRSWAVQLLVDQQPPSSKVAAQFAARARSETSGLVLSFLASAMRKATTEQKFEIARGLVSHREFADDRVFPLMVWYGIQPEVPNNTTAAIGLAERSEIPKIRRFITRRIFEELAPNPAAADELTKLLLKERSAEFQMDVLSGMEEALKSVNKAIPPSSWQNVAGALEKSGDAQVRGITQQLQALFGDGRALENLRAVVADLNADLPQRRRALTTLLQVRAPNLIPLLGNLLMEINLAPDAIRGLASVGDAYTPELLLKRYAELPANAKTEAVNTLISRPAFAGALLDAVQRGLVKRQEINATQLRQLRAHNDAELKRKVGSIWPQLDESPSGKKKLFEKYKALLTPERVKAADAGAGRAVFQQACAACHTLYGEGAKIGPDLTGSDRANLDYLLDNIIDPSGVVPDSYRVTMLTLKDDRSLTGIVLNETERALTFQTVSEKLALQKSEIEQRQPSQLSMMPEGLLEALSEDQVLQLFAYLMSQAPPKN
jgi:putative membrane-bound dehydrogenase-like protein